MRRSTVRAIAGCALTACLSGQAGAEGIYTCVDAQGRRLTADRPIAECIDREQKELNASGTMKRKLGPSPTAQEIAAEEERQRQATQERRRLADEKRRERALLTRYPDAGVHDKERQASLSRVDVTIAMALKSTDSLLAQRKLLETELEFYAKDPSRVPARLRRQIEENEQHIDAQRRFVANQESEKKRVNAHFDEERVKLVQLWARRDAPATAAAPAAVKR